MNNQNIADVINTIQRAISKDKDSFSGEDLTNEINRIIDSFEIIFRDEATLEQREFIIKRVFASASRTMEDGVGLDNNKDSDFKPWYEDRKGEIENIYWNDYKTHLVVN